jgi:hypothetical protein
MTVRVEPQTIAAAVAAEVVEHLVLAEASVRKDWVGAQLVSALRWWRRLDHVERALVVRQRQAVRAGGVEGNAVDRVRAVLARVKAVD